MIFAIVFMDRKVNDTFKIDACLQFELVVQNDSRATLLYLLQNLIINTREYDTAAHAIIELSILSIDFNITYMLIDRTRCIKQ